jgi:heme-degrading monooxygenase HmoA
MATIGQTFTSGDWRAKEGKEDSFVEAWASFADWCARNGWGAEPPYLLKDVGDPRHFVSFGAWENGEQVAAWRALPEFREFLGRMRELCDDVRPITCTLVAHPGA